AQGCRRSGTRIGIVVDDQCLQLFRNNHGARPPDRFASRTNIDGEDSMSTTEVVRCGWAGSDALYQHYHDREWGRAVVDDTRLFEKLCLEGFQSGLSWLTILRKRENFRAAFHGFDIDRVAAMGGADVERLLQDAGIIRHRGKIASTINNAKRAQAIRDE